MDKVMNMADAISKIKDKDTVIIGNIGNDELTKSVFKSLGENPAKDLFFVTVDSTVHSNAQFKDILSKRTRGMIAPSVEAGAVPSNVPCEISLEDILIERVRAGGSGIPAFYMIGNGSGNEQEKRTIDGKECVKETGIKGNVAIIRAPKSDTEGNCYIPAGAMKKSNMYLPFAADYVIAVVEEVVPVGDITPEYVSVPGVLVEAVVKAGSR
ncbi:MAG: CoA transferase subunit A [Spirochaetota bacterium]